MNFHPHHRPHLFRFFYRLEILFALGLFLFLLTLAVAVAGVATVKWTNPPTYDDKTPLPEATIQQTRIEYGTCSAPSVFGSKLGEFVVAGSATTGISPNLTPGTYCFRAYTTANNKESLPSNPASLTLLNITSKEETVYTVAKETDRWVFLPVGTAPLGTPCISNQSANDYFAVPRTYVVWSGNVRPPLVFTHCG